LTDTFTTKAYKFEAGPAVGGDLFVSGFEIGSGFEGTKMRGSEHNDLFISDASSGNKKLATITNNSGGIQGGISNGEPVVFRVAFKPPATIGKTQVTCRFDGEQCLLNAKGRHDPCVVPRAVPIVEAMAALVLADQILLQQSRINSCNAVQESTSN
jgi:chorismate synthase